MITMFNRNKQTNKCSKHLGILETMYDGVLLTGCLAADWRIKRVGKKCIFSTRIKSSPCTRVYRVHAFRVGLAPTLKLLRFCAVPDVTAYVRGRHRGPEQAAEARCREGRNYSVYRHETANETITTRTGKRLLVIPCALIGRPGRPFL